MLDKRALEQKAKELQEQGQTEQIEHESVRGNRSLELNRKVATPADKFDVFHHNFVKEYVPGPLKEKMMTDVDKETFRKSVFSYANRSKYRGAKICHSADCLSAKLKECPFVVCGKEYIPEDQRCPMEMMELDAMEQIYRDILINECNADKTMVEMHIKEIVNVEMQLTKTDEIIADRGFLERRPIFALPKSETVIDGVELSPLLKLQEDLSRRRARLYRSILITPESKAKYKMRQEKDIAMFIEELKRKAGERFESMRSGQHHEVPEEAKELIEYNVEKEDKEERD